MFSSSVQKLLAVNFPYLCHVAKVGGGVGFIKKHALLYSHNLP